MKINRYVVFAGRGYYPRGGWEDFRNSFKTLGAAVAYANDLRENWFQIVDLETGEDVSTTELLLLHATIIDVDTN